MTDNHHPIPPHEAITLIEEALSQSTQGAPKGTPKCLKRSEISTMVSLFQPRTLEGNIGADELHLAELTEALKAKLPSGRLDPIIVWWGGDRYYVIDGHHRLIAYQRNKVLSGIPVEVFEGTLDEAREMSGLANNKNKLPMRPEDRQNFAWSLVVTSSLSKSRIAIASGVGTSTVANMRKTMRRLIEKEYELSDLSGLTWQDAYRSGQNMLPFEDKGADSAIMKRARRYAEAIVRATGNMAFRDPDAFAQALFLIDKRLPASIIENYQWQQMILDEGWRGPEELMRWLENPEY